VIIEHQLATDDLAVIVNWERFRRTHDDHRANGNFTCHGERVMDVLASVVLDARDPVTVADAWRASELSATEFTRAMSDLEGIGWLSYTEPTKPKRSRGAEGVAVRLSDGAAFVVRDSVRVQIGVDPRFAPSNRIILFDQPIAGLPPRPRRTPKQGIPTALRWQVWRRDDFTCQACGTRERLSVDHIVPESRGGPMTLTNLQTLCMSCNSRKGARL